MSDDSEPRYTSDEMLAAAQAQGTPVTKRLIVDWVDLGLLDRSLKRGLGRSKGISATWPENQLQLFLLILRKRAEAPHVRALCNVPVSLWLYFGPDYVPLSQAQTAMQTFAERNKAMSAKSAKRSAKLVVETLSGPDTRREDKTALVEALIYATGGGPRPDLTVLRERAQAVFDRTNVGRTLGPPGAQVSAENWVRIAQANYAGIDAIDERDDALFNQARLALQQFAIEYGARQPQFAQDPGVGHLYEAPTDSFLINHACQQLMSHLGFLRLTNTQ